MCRYGYWIVFGMMNRKYILGDRGLVYEMADLCGCDLGTFVDAYYWLPDLLTGL